MKTLLFILAFVAVASPKISFALHSAAFSAGAAIPSKYSYDKFGCSGKNISPELRWSSGPEGTKSYALTVYDPDARSGKGWWHWVVYGIGPATRELTAGEPFPGLEGTTSFGSTGYGGPCPPPGDTPHHYVFTLYALDTAIGGSLDGPALLTAIKGHVLAKAVLVGRFGR